MASDNKGKPPYPPFTAETAQIKVKAAQDAWNTKCVQQTCLFPLSHSCFKWPTLSPKRKKQEINIRNSQNRDPTKVKLAYTPDSIWRNRDTFLQGREEIEAFLTKKWERENGYRLRKELFAFTDNKIAVQFWYEWYDVQGQWWRTYGLEDWTFAEDGLMRKRQSELLTSLVWA